MHTAETLKTIEAILASAKELAPHLQSIARQSLAQLARGGGSSAGSLLLVGGVALGVGAGVALLLAPQAGSELRARLRSGAQSAKEKLRQTLAERKGSSEEPAPASEKSDAEQRAPGARLVIG